MLLFKLITKVAKLSEPLNHHLQLNLYSSTIISYVLFYFVFLTMVSTLNYSFFKVFNEFFKITLTEYVIERISKVDSL